MPESDRLDELRRQRAKLDAELAKLEGELVRKPLTPAQQRPRPAAIPASTQELFDKLSAEESVPPPSKSGCWLAFAVLLLGAAGGIALAMKLIYHR